MARPANAAVLKSISAGDKVSAHPPTMPSEPKAAPAQAGTEAVPKRPGAALDLSARQVAERFFADAFGGKHETLPPFAKEVLAGLLDVKMRAPYAALVEVDTDDALAISNAMPGGRRVVVQFKRATPSGVPSGWLTGPWTVTAVHLHDADRALDALADFLNRHPSARVEPAAAALDAGRR